jgi:hypothetical protein
MSLYHCHLGRTSTRERLTIITSCKELEWKCVGSHSYHSRTYSCHSDYTLYLDCTFYLLLATHFYLQRTSTCNALLLATHFYLQRTSTCNALLLASHFYCLSRTSTVWVALLLSESHFYCLSRTSTCVALLLSESHFYCLSRTSTDWVALLLASHFYLYLYYYIIILLEVIIITASARR